MGKCKVVETIDLVLVKDANTGKLDNEIIVSDVKIMEGSLPGHLESSKLNHQNENENKDQENLKYENPSIQKEDIVNSIKSKTDQKIEEVNENEVGNEVPNENEIKTYESSDIITSEKVKKKKDKKKKDTNKNKKEAFPVIWRVA